MTKPNDCQRCAARPGKEQPTDGDASMLFAAAAHVDYSDEAPIRLCSTCVRTLEAALRAAGIVRRASAATTQSQSENDVGRTGAR